ncbi:MAG: methyltransferase domain-containing protein [Candidatus Woesebacteria bacterium]|nr:methyltransferase domain-containing protein [Candidatus Woesebacteria bacterium]
METKIETPINFQRFEYLGWQKAAAKYSRFSLLTQQSVGDLIKHLNIQFGDKLLDVATGPGFLASRAQEIGAETVGIDLSEEMIELAKKNYPKIEFRVANAEKTGFYNQTFDKIAVNHGLIHFARPNVVLSELNRVARRRAVIGLTIWDSPDRTVAFSIVSKAISDLSSVQINAPKGIPMSFYSEKKNVRELLDSNGWILTEFIHLPVVWKLETPESIIDILMEGTVLMASKLKKQPRSVLSQIRDVVIHKLKPYTTANGKVEVPQGVLLVVGKK